MSSDPAVSGKDAIRVLGKLSFRLDRIEGSHHMMVKEGHPLHRSRSGAWVRMMTNAC